MNNTPFFTPSPIHVLALGDIMLDRFIYGQVDRISPEAPVPVFHSRKAHFSLGGVGNVIRNLTDLQAHSTVIAMCGNDSKSIELKSLLNDHNTIHSHLIPYGTTICKTRYVSAGQQLMRVDEENVTSLPQNLVDEIIERITKTIHQYQLIILSDYAKGFLSNDICQRTIQLAKQHQIPVLVDPKGKDYQKYHGCSIITPNLKELADITGKSLKTTDEIIHAATDLLHSLDLEHVLVTRSAEGMTLVSRNGLSHHLSANAREVYDVSGAGDTVVATLAIAIAKGMDMVDACRIANTAAGVVVGKAGTATLHLAELEQALINENLQTAEQKIAPLSRTLDLIQTWRHQGLTIGFTNGCFDLLHAGHIHSLQSAKSKCDRLIVGINSDASVKRLKGQDRPIQSQDVRALVLSALQCIDAVILFEEDTPLNIIENILPDVLFKGADYTVDTVVGADIVQQNGGKIELISLVPGLSTTKTIEKLRQVG